MSDLTFFLAGVLALLGVVGVAIALRMVTYEGREKSGNALGLASTAAILVAFFIVYERGYAHGEAATAASAAGPMVGEGE